MLNRRAVGSIDDNHFGEMGAAALIIDFTGHHHDAITGVDNLFRLEPLKCRINQIGELLSLRHGYDR